MAMKTLLRDRDAEEILQRIGSLIESDVRRWGRMSVQGMVCHLGDSYDLALGLRHAEAVKLPIPVPMMKWLALQLPLQWSRNIRTVPVVEQGSGGRPPAAWDGDMQLLMESFHAFREKSDGWNQHPIFRAMSTEEWMRWGYLHADHHLRQFGR